MTTGIAQRSPRAAHAAREVEVCAPCHARRAEFDDARAGQPLLDAYRPTFLLEGLYRADGQMQDEVYNYGSFLQSRMHAAGVTCSDCHDPHSLKLRRRWQRRVRAVPPAVDASTSRRITGTRPARRGPPASPATCRPRRTWASTRATTTDALPASRPHGSARHAQRLQRLPREAAARSGRPTRSSAGTPAPKPGFQTFAEALRAGDRAGPGARAARGRRRRRRSRRSSAPARSRAWVRSPVRRSSRPSRRSTTPTRWCARPRRARSRAPSRRCGCACCRGCSTTRCARCGWRRRAASPATRSGAADAPRAVRSRAGRAEAALRFNADRPEAQPDRRAEPCCAAGRSPRSPHSARRSRSTRRTRPRR